MLAQLIIGGLAIGCCYGLIAMAMVIIYKTSNVLNFAQGELAMVSTFFAYTLLVYLKVPFIAAVLLTVVFAFALGAVVELLFLRPAREPTLLGLIIITLGCEMILFGLAGWIWGSDTKSLPSPIEDTSIHMIGSVVISDLDIAIFAASLAIMLLLFLFFRFSKLGIAMKATAQDPEAAKLMGIRVKRIYTISWGLSSALGGLAGILIAPITKLDPPMMMDPLLKGFAAAVLGGMTSLFGCVLGGWILGVLENLVGGYVSTAFKSVVAFLVIVLVLCIRPSGLFARHYERKV
jgi:branched-chain amino acid transport system permease protein